MMKRKRCTARILGRLKHYRPCHCGKVKRLPEFRYATKRRVLLGLSQIKCMTRGPSSCVAQGTTLQIMNRARTRRLSTIVLMVCSLLFMQLALAQYVCPAPVLGDRDFEAIASAMEMAPGQPCSGMESPSEQPQLCHQHCTDAAQSYEPVKVPTLTLPAVVQLLQIPLRVDDTRRVAALYASSRHAQPPPPLVFLSTLRLRV
jgi:hypothetical protein